MNLGFVPDQDNPYAAPQSIDPPLPPASKTAENGGAWREGNVVVLLHGAHLPPRCWKCNGEAQVELRRQLAWHHPSWFLMLLIGPVPYVIAALIVRKKARFALPLCWEHAGARRRNIFVAWALAVGGIVLLFLAASSFTWSVLMGWTGFAWIVAGVIYGVTMGNVCGAKRIDGYAAWLTGASRAYLDSLPHSVARTY